MGPLKQTLAVVLGTLLVAGCQPFVTTLAPRVVVNVSYPTALSAPNASDWLSQRISGVTLNRLRADDLKRRLLATGPSNTVWGSAGLTLSGRCANGPAAVFMGGSQPASLDRKVFYLTDTGNFYRLDRTSTVVPAPLALGGTFSSTAITLSPDCTRAYVLDDAGRFIVIDTVNMTQTTVATLGAAKWIAPSYDPFTSLSSGGLDNVYVATNAGTVYHYRVTRATPSSAFSVTQIASYVVASGTPLSTVDQAGNTRLRSSPVVLNGVIYTGDTAGVFHQYDTASVTDNPVVVGQPVYAPPALDFGSSDVPTSAFVNAGQACHWIDLATGTDVASQSLALDDGDPTQQKGALLDYSFSGGGTWEYLAPRDTVTLDIQTPEQTLPGTSPRSVRSRSLLCPADANLRTVTYVVSALAGSGTAGYTNATGTAARFDQPQGLAVDAAGNVYVADTKNNTIRRVTPAGQVTTFAGSTTGASGNADGTGTAASFNEPKGICIDPSGNLYVADTNNDRIRRITPEGVVTTLAGSTGGYQDATGTAARFQRPEAIAIDSAGVLYVADRDNHRIRKVTAAGVVTTLAGSSSGYVDATGTSARFNQPEGVALDSAGNLYVADQNNNRLRKVTPAGVVTTLAGSSSGNTDATGTSAKFNSLQGVVVDASGNVFVADAGNHRIRRVSPSGVVTTVAGSSSGNVNGTGTASRFNNPTAMAVDTSGNLYVADTNNHSIRKITLTDVTSNGPAVSLLRFKSGLTTAQTGKVYTKAYLSLLPIDAGFAKVPEVRQSSPYYAPSLALWDGSVITNSADSYQRPAIQTANVGKLYGASVNGLKNLYQSTSRYINFDVTSAFNSITPGVTTEFGLALRMNSGGLSYYPDGALALPGNGDTAATTSVRYFTDPTDTSAVRLSSLDLDANGVVTGPLDVTERRPILQLFYAGAIPDADAIRTGPIIDPSTKKVYVFNTNCLFTLSYNSAEAWSDTAESTNYTKMVSTQFGHPGQCGGSTYVSGSQRYILQNASSPVVNFDGSASFVLDRYPDTSNFKHSLSKVTLGYDETDRLSGRGSATTPVYRNSSIISAYMAIDPYSNPFSTGGNVYYGVDSKAYQSDQALPTDIGLQVTSYLVSTVAGSSAGYLDATGTSARFDQPKGGRTNDAGSIYVADTNNSVIRIISPAGVVTTLAGSPGNSGSTDGTGSGARFNKPQDCALDPSGTLYVADTDNHTIRKVTIAGTVTTLAGSAGNPGSVDGTGTAARFKKPQSLAVDVGGNIYVADRDNHAVRRVTPAGVVTTFAGSLGNSGTTDGTGTGARFRSPEGVGIDAAGNVYVADSGNHIIRKITPAGVVTTLAGSAGNSGTTDGTGTAARFNSPRGICIDTAGTIYVTDTNNHRIRKITAAGVVTTLAGSSSGNTDGDTAVARFNAPEGLSITRAGVIYVSDKGNHRVRAITPQGVCF